MKKDFEANGWSLPTLQANMRNQVNIAKVQVGDIGSYQMRSFIEKLPSGSSLIGEVPMLFKVWLNDWDQKKDEVLKHCINLMGQKSDKNIVVLWDNDSYFKNVANDIKRVVNDKKVVAYPSKQSKKDGITKVKQFVEENDNILVTKNQYFNGCESANVIFLIHGSGDGPRNSVLRGVQNIICVQLTYGSDPKIKGMKEDDRFL